MPTPEDFRSDRERGKQPRDDSSDALRRHEGFSVWLDLSHARAVARRFPRMGRFIAEVELPADTRIEPFADVFDHQTAYGDPEAFVRAVVRVVPAD